MCFVVSKLIMYLKYTNVSINNATVFFMYIKTVYKTTNWTRGNNYKRDRTEPAHVVRPCSENGRKKIAQNSTEVDAKTKNTRKTD